MSQIDLTRWLESRPQSLAAVIQSVAGSCAAISRSLARAAIPGDLVMAGRAPVPEPEPHKLSSMAGRLFARSLAACPHLAAWSNEEQADVTVSDAHASRGAYLAVFTSLERTLTSDSCAGLGTVFSVLPHLFRGTPASAAAFMQPGRRQVAAGYAFYGASTALTLSLGDGVHVFALDPDPRESAGRWWLTRDAVEVPASTTEFAIDMSNQRFWEKPVQRYVAECLAGESGPRGRDFQMRWDASLVTDVHRILGRGGLFMVPRDGRQPFKPGRLRLMHEAAPMAWLMEQAGGASTTGTAPLLDLVPDALHQQVPVFLGSRDEVQRVVAYHEDPSENVSRQLFKTRSLFIQPNA